MNLLKIAALMALASLPILLIKKEKQVRLEAIETDNIFDHELSAD